ncbi:uncharacterized protein M6B38_313945 [Iris pallida]|uniref:DUF220 domain-containing protein n=1 Tax=Iris pallida TaxID=29817 RepID=A0AAX6HEI3_IRIPA|nr:uncharacterized protein M6B38_313945 [Iris pallida]
MDDMKVNSLDTKISRRQGHPTIFIPALDFLGKIPERLHSSLKSHLKHLAKNDLKISTMKPMKMTEKEMHSSWEVNLDKHLQAWKENPNWVDQPAEIKVSVPEGSLCNLKVKLNVGLPPDACYNIVIDPENKRVFKNISEVISRNVLVDEGHRQRVELEQAATWRFLWWSGTVSVHVFVDQDRRDHSVKFKQGKSGFMEKFEGCWKVEPLFIDEQSCFPHKPRTMDEYYTCTGGKGRVGSIVSLDQLIQPAIVPPPPISWYLRGITRKTTEMLIEDFLAETARLRGAIGNTYSSSTQELEASFTTSSADCPSHSFDDNIKERWRARRNMRRRGISRLLGCDSKLFGESKVGKNFDSFNSCPRSSRS